MIVWLFVPHVIFASFTVRFCPCAGIFCPFPELDVYFIAFFIPIMPAKADLGIAVISVSNTSCGYEVGNPDIILFLWLYGDRPLFRVSLYLMPVSAQIGTYVFKGKCCG